MDTNPPKNGDFHEKTGILAENVICFMFDIIDLILGCIEKSVGTNAIDFRTSAQVVTIKIRVGL